jgi:hypothetical protein
MIFPELGKSNATNRSQPVKGAYPQGGSVMGMVYGVGAETPKNLLPHTDLGRCMSRFYCRVFVDVVDDRCSRS